MLLRLAFLMCVLLSVLLPRAAVAQWNPPTGLTWLCWLETHDGYFVRCRLDDDPLAQALAEGDAILPVTLTRPVDNRAIRQELFRPGRAPNVARLVREQPARFAALTWSIPVYSMPFDDSPLRELAQSVLCGSDLNCAVFLGLPEAPTPLARLERR